MAALKFNCPKCQHPLEATPDMMNQQVSCPACETTITVPSFPLPVRPVERRQPSDSSTTTTSGTATWSLVLGILGVTCIGPLGAIPAVICGHIALSQIKKSDGEMKGQGLAIAGLALGYAGIVLTILMGFMIAAISVPAFGKARGQAQTNACINNLRQIDAAKEQVALELNWTNGTPVVTGDMKVNSYIRGLVGTTLTPNCPAGGTYTYNAIGLNPTCSEPGHALPSF